MSCLVYFPATVDLSALSPVLFLSRTGVSATAEEETALCLSPFLCLAATADEDEEASLSLSLLSVCFQTGERYVIG